MPVYGPKLQHNALELPGPQFFRTAAAHPHQEAVVAKSARLTYRELAREVKRYQAGLAWLGLGPGDRLGVMVGNDWPYVALYWAALASGICFVPLNTQLARPEVAELVEHAQPGRVITDDSLMPQMPESFGDRVLALSHFQHRLASLSGLMDQTPFADADAPALILYTSGTVERPKGAILTHRNLAVQFHQAVHWLGHLTPTDRIAAWFPLFHTVQHVFLAPPLTIGASVVISHFSPHAIRHLLGDEAITVLFGVPAMYHILLTQDEFRAETFPALRLLAYGGNAMPLDTIRELKARFPRAALQNLYGQAENSPSVSALDDRDILAKPGSVGRPVPGMAVAIVDDTNQEVGPGVVGEIVTKGPNLMRGYFKDASATQEALSGGWYHTGDLGYVDADGFLYVVDRKKDMIVRGGQNVYPVEVENVLIKHPDVTECAVVGVAHPILGEEVAAVVVRRPGSHLTDDALAQYLRDRVAGYKQPVRYHFVDTLPHNASGKVLRRELRHLARMGIL